MFAYALEISFAWLIFYLVYAVFLQKERFFALNRYYLLAGLLAGIALPFLQIELYSNYIPATPVLLDEITIGIQETVGEAPSKSISWMSVLIVVYALGLLFKIGSLLLGLFKIQRLYSNAIVSTQDDYYLVHTNDLHSPFSFGKYLFISNQVPTSNKEQDYILEHEATHIRQNHTIDLLLIELIGTIFWFNPLVWLYRAAIRDQHEYLADQAVLSHAPIKEYGQLLIEQSIPGLKIGLVNHLIYSQLKKRINMMTKKHSAKIPYARYAMSLVAFMLVFWTISCQKESETSQLTEHTTKKGKTPYFEDLKEIYEDADYLKVPPSFPGCDEGDREDKSTCSYKSLMQFIFDHTKYPQLAKEKGIEGKAWIRFTIDTDGLVKNPTIHKAQNEILGQAALEAIQAMQTEHITWTPATNRDGELTSVKYTIPISFRLK